MAGVVQVAKVLSIFTSFSVSLSPVPSTLQMGKTQSTGEVSILPLASLGGNAYIWVMYAILTSSFFPLLVTTLFGVLTSLYYVTIYYRWTAKRPYVRKVLAIVLAGLVITTTYVVLGVTGVTNQSTDQVATIVGFIAVTFNIILYASPLETARKIVQMKSASSLPIALCVTSFFNCTLWVIIGIADNDMFVLTPNAIGMVLGAIQITLYIIYNPNNKKKSDMLAIDGHDVKDVVSIIVSPREGTEDRKPAVVYEALRSPLAPINT